MRSLTPLTLLGLAGLALQPTLLHAADPAQPWPTRPLTIVVTYPPGGVQQGRLQGQAGQPEERERGQGTHGVSPSNQCWGRGQRISAV